MKKLFVKSLMTIGVVGLVGLTSVAMAVETDWYGSIRAGVETTNAGADDSKAVLDLGKEKYSRIGIRASGDLGNYQRVGAQIEFSIAEPGKKSLNTRRRNVWLSGVWGTVTIGKQGGIYRSAANWDQSSYLGGNVRYGGDVNNAEGITYASNGIGPFKFDVEIVGENGLDRWAATAHYNVGPVTVNFGHHNNSRSSVASMAETFVELDTSGSAGITSSFSGEYRVVITPSTVPVYNHSNSAISFNGSIGGLDFYLAHESSKLNASANGTSIPSTISSTIGAFVSYKFSEKNKFYTEFESGATKSTTDTKTAILLGYSRGLGDGITFGGEYVQINENTKSKITTPTTLVLVLKYDF